VKFYVGTNHKHSYKWAGEVLWRDRS